MLEHTNPETGMWPIIRPALQVLVTKEVKALAKEIPELGQKIISAILRFGLKQESESARVIFYLHDFDVELLQDPSIKETLRESLQIVRQRAKRINSSDVVEKIQALLLAPIILIVAPFVVKTEIHSILHLDVALLLWKDWHQRKLQSFVWH